MADQTTQLPVVNIDPTSGAEGAVVAEDGSVPAGANALQVVAATYAFDGTNQVRARAETDDDAVPGANVHLAIIGFSYGWDGTNWERLQTNGSGALDVNLTVALPTGANVIGNVGLEAGTNNIGDVDVLTAPATAAEAAALPAVFTVVAGDDGVDTHPLQVDASGSLKAILQANGGTIVGDVNINGTPTVDTELPAAAALADDAANPTAPAVGAFFMGYDSGNTNWNRVEVDDAGHLQVDVLTGGGSDTPTNPLTSTGTASAVAADGGTGDVDTGNLTSATEKLAGIDVASSVAMKAQLTRVENSVETIFAVVIIPAGGGTVSWRPPHRNYFSVTFPGTGTNVFRVQFTNLDKNNAADAYATFYSED